MSHGSAHAGLSLNRALLSPLQVHEMHSENCTATA